jgi:hypothetical protein
MAAPYVRRSGPPSVVPRAGLRCNRGRRADAAPRAVCGVLRMRPAEPSRSLRGDMNTLHVEPRNGSWVVRRDDAPTPLSEHADAGAATRAAQDHAPETGATRVLVHDRYHRTHAFRATRPRRRFSRV